MNRSLPCSHLAGLLILLTMASTALPTVAGTPSRSGLAVKVVQPDRGDLLSGQVVLRAEVDVPAGLLVEEVLFVLDGTPIAADREPPYEAVWAPVDTLRDYLIRVTALGSDGGRAYDLVSVPVLGPVTRVSVTGRAPEFVLLSVTFLDAAGHPLVDVEKEEIRVLEDGEEQVIDVFAPDDRPLAAELLLDASQSTAPFWDDSDRSTRLFAETLRGGDRAAVEAFNNASFSLAPLGASPEEIETATSSFEDWGGVTRMYDAMSRGALLLLGREETRRRALVVLTDAGDHFSKLTAMDTDEYLRRGGVELHAVLFRPPQDVNFPVQFDIDSLQGTLVGMARRSGGWSYQAAGAPIEEIFLRIGEQLRAQYVLGYNSISRRPPGKERKVEVELARPGSQVRVRLGHFGGQTLGQYLAAEMSRGPERRRIVAIRATLLNRDPDALRAMVDALAQGKGTAAGVAREARLAFLEMGADGVSYLRDGLAADKRRVQDVAGQVLVDLFSRLTGQDGAEAAEEALLALGDGDRAAGRRTLEELQKAALTDAGRDRLRSVLSILGSE